MSWENYFFTTVETALILVALWVFYRSGYNKGWQEGLEKGRGDR